MPGWGQSQKLRERHAINSLEPSRAQSYQHFDFELLASETVRKYISIMLSHPLCGTQLWQPKQSNLRLIPLFSQIFWGGWNLPLTQRDQQSPSSWPCICFRDKHDIWQEPVRLEIFVELLEKKKTPSSFSRVAAQTSFCWLWTRTPSPGTLLAAVWNLPYLVSGSRKQADVLTKRKFFCLGSNQTLFASFSYRNQYTPFISEVSELTI